MNEFLQEIGNRSRREGGYHLPKTMLLRAMARVLQDFVRRDRVDLNQVYSEEDFVLRVRKAFGLR